MSGTGPSYEQLLERARGNGPMEIMLELLVVENYEKWVELIHRAIDLALRRMSENPELYSKRSEDELTIEIINQLRASSFAADHESKIGGHVDIRVRGARDSLWLGEAKIHKDDYAWLYKGFEQLDSRYSTGNERQNAGGIIIYCRQERVDRIMSRWKDHLSEQRSDISFEKCSENALAFRSAHPHHRTGIHLSIRHVPLSLYFDPRDNR